ncbi:uncharacterized protein LOC126841306 [Adelges cooleyi]|uniref:uncharacterized protein LOC126841306 n=1 Tax=Adelges cooleyi TaxID=133065 RepID=UPI00217F3A03|nr:uncharacterized protein LOC126841306 [Adelges cooleyi]XP_050433652.1 uncharacterized protein LOC126841306 [Adelges cooleyi]
MDVKALDDKPLEVVWKRNRSIRTPAKTLPEMKTINLESQGKEIKNTSKFKAETSKGIRSNRIKKKLFSSPMVKNKNSILKNERNSEIPNNMLTLPPVTRSKSPNILANCDKLVKNHIFMQRTSEKPNNLTANTEVCLNTKQTDLSAKQICNSKSPVLMSNRKRFTAENENNIDDFVPPTACGPEKNLQLAKKSKHLNSKLTNLRLDDFVGKKRKLSNTISDKMVKSPKLCSNFKNCKSNKLDNIVNKTTTTTQVTCMSNQAHDNTVIDNIQTTPCCMINELKTEDGVEHTKEVLEKNTATCDDQELQQNTIDGFTSSKCKKTTSSDTSSETNIIPVTQNVDTNIKTTIDFSPVTMPPLYVPFIEVDNSPRHEEQNVCIPPDQSPIISEPDDVPYLISELDTPVKSHKNTELFYKIDSIESPTSNTEIISYHTPKMNSKHINSTKNENLSPSYFDSAKKRKKICKTGFRGKFRELLNRKKSEICIQEFEMKSDRPRRLPDKAAVLLQVLEVSTDCQKVVLLCNHCNSEFDDKKVVVILDNNFTRKIHNNNVVCIYRPWLKFEPTEFDFTVYLGVIHLEVVKKHAEVGHSVEHNDFESSCKSTLYQKKLLWECRCPKDCVCSCLGEQSVYNYLQYIILRRQNC